MNIFMVNKSATFILNANSTYFYTDKFNRLG